jgi:hypothetical protein
MKGSILLISFAVLLSGCCIGGLKKADVDPNASVVDFKKKSIGKANIAFNFEFNCCLNGKAKEQVEQLEAKMLGVYNDYYDGKIYEETMKKKLAYADKICRAIKSRWCDNVHGDNELFKSLEIKGLVKGTGKSPDIMIKAIDMAISQL